MTKIARCLILPLVALMIYGAAEASPTSDCKVVGEFAKTIMAARQTGMPMATMMEAANKIDGKSPAPAIIKLAYLIPRFELEEKQLKAVVDFERVMYDACFNVRSTQQAAQ